MLHTKPLAPGLCRFAAAAAALVAVAGCASPSPQACMLVGACASQTTQAKVVETPAKALSKVCFEGLSMYASMPLTIKAVTRGGSGGISDTTRKSAQDSAKAIVDVYRKEARQAVVGHLSAAGVESTACTGAESADVGRLTAMVYGVTTDTGGLGWKSQLDIQAALHVGPKASSPVWTGSFLTGNKTAVGAAPDRDNVNAFAANLTDEIGRSGWIARR